MKRKLLFCFASFLVMGVAFVGCQSSGMDYGDIEDGETFEVDVNAEDGEGVETVVIDEQTFSEEPSLRAGTQEVVSELRTVHFNFDSSSLTSEGQRILRDNVAYLLANPNINVVVEGHCDNRGTVAYNLALGQRRAMQVKAQYVALGVPANRIATISYGKEQPVELGNNEMAWAANRRAETKIVSQ
jgi:peptidoglycan-associated lipoprotein